MSEVKTNKISSLASNNDITIDPDGTGDTIVASGNVILNNANYLQFKDSGGTARDVLTIDAYNGLNINSAGGGSAAPIVFKENGSEISRFDSSGNLLIGSSTNVGTGDHKVSVDIGATGRALGLSTTSTTAKILVSFVNGNGTVGTIQTNGSATSYVTSSDYRLKENVTDIADATTRLKQLNPVRFNFIVDADTTVDGFLAHEAQTVVPESVTGTKDEVDDDGNPVYQGIDQSKLVPLLVKTIQELEARITALEAE